MCSNNFSGVIWHCAAELNSIQLHDSFVVVTLESINYITLHYITLQINKTATEVYFRHSRFIWAPPSCVVGHLRHQRSRFSPACTLYRLSRAGEASFLSISAGKASVNLKMQILIRMHPWKAHLARTCPGEGTGPLWWLPFFRSGMKHSRIKPQQCYTPTQT